jgi:hypothetical protein
VLSYPPATRTFPDGNKVLVCAVRACAIDAAGVTPMATAGADIAANNNATARQPRCMIASAVVLKVAARARWYSRETQSRKLTLNI